MPLYTFGCSACDRKHEIFMSFRQLEDYVPGDCENCGSSLMRVFQPAALRTTKTWRRKLPTLCLGDQFGPSEAHRQDMEYRIRVAQSKGAQITSSMFYDAGLASYPGDPDGFVPHDDPAGHYRRVATRKRLAVNNELAKIDPGPPQPPPPKPLAIDIVNDIINKRARDDPGILQKDRNELVQQIRDEFKREK